MKKILEFLKLSTTAAELSWKVFTFVVVFAGSTTASVLAAGTELFQQLGPLAWFAVAVVAALLFTLILYLFTMSVRARAEANLATALSAKPSPINPLNRSFEDLIIPIEALRLPGASLHERKHFRRCKFVGPGALAFLGCHFVKIGFHDAGHILTIPDGTLITGICALKECTIEECEFFAVTLLVPRLDAEVYKAIPGAQVAI